MNFLTLVNNVKTLVKAITSSAGAADAGKIPGLDASGRLDSSFMPAGIGADTQSILASEALAAGDFVNVYDNSGTPNVRKASAADATKPANGFVIAGAAAAANATVYFRGSNTGVSGLTAGTYALSAATPGAVVALAAAPSATGNTLQVVGAATAAGVIETTINEPIVRA